MKLNKLQIHFIEEHMMKGALRKPFIITEITPKFEICFHSCNLFIKNEREFKKAKDIEACFYETWKEVKKKLKINKKAEYIG